MLSEQFRRLSVAALQRQCHLPGDVKEERREATMAMTLRPNEASILYNAACTFSLLAQKAEAMDALSKSLARRPPGQ